MVRIISALFLAAAAASSFAQEKLQLVDDPPERHIVVPGDTLWGIAGKFLKQPWRWPDVWRLNKEQVKNPHRIYPGDIVVLDLSGIDPQLKVAKPVRVQPQVYAEAIKQEIPSIPASEIEAFTSQPLVVDAAAIRQAPMIVASQEDRMYMGNGDIGFVTGIDDGDVLDWTVYQQGKPLYDPDTKELLGYEAADIGRARLEKLGNPATIRIVTAREEITRGARLMPAPKTVILSYVPHPPEQLVDARIIQIYSGVRSTGKLSVVSINRGLRDGIEQGHVLALYRRQTSFGYDENNRRVAINLPDERYGLAFVFRTFERISYALVMDSDRPVVVGDALKNP